LGADVDWYVLFDRDAQLSVGCQHTEAGADAVRAACDQVLRSLRLR
jgi:type VII secretion-associated protein (TIGR03931 family)